MAKKKTVKKINLDEIARSAGFTVFVAKLTGYGSYVLYTNEDRSVNRVYDQVTGNVVSEYFPKNNTSYRFHNPPQVTPIDEICSRVRWYTGKGNRIKT
jgi:hypothetical protein